MIVGPNGRARVVLSVSQPAQPKKLFRGIADRIHAQTAAAVIGHSVSGLHDITKPTPQSRWGGLDRKRPSCRVVVRKKNGKIKLQKL